MITELSTLYDKNNQCPWNTIPPNAEMKRMKAQWAKKTPQWTGANKAFGATHGSESHSSFTASDLRKSLDAPLGAAAIVHKSLAAKQLHASSAFNCFF